MRHCKPQSHAETRRSLFELTQPNAVASSMSVGGNGYLLNTPAINVFVFLASHLAQPSLRKMPFLGRRPTSSEPLADPSITNDATSFIISMLSFSSLSKTGKRFVKATGTPIRGSTRSQAYRKDAAVGECPAGQAFYSCASGFRGCCSINPCDPGATCPDAQASSDVAATATAESATSSVTTSPVSPTVSADTATTSTDDANATTQTSQSTPQTSQASTSGTTTAVGSSVVSATVTPSAVSTTSTSTATPTFAPAPACPAANGTTYADTNNIPYTIHCNSDNNVGSSGKTPVSVGGYGECFGQCSIDSTCAGFTYVGLDSGTCYFKGSMPVNSYVPKAESNYISCAKIVPTQYKNQPTPPKKDNVGAIAGSIVGGIAVLGLALFAVAFFARRRRRTLESRRATVTNVLGGAVEPNRDDGHTLPMHQRSGSTSHDVFAPYGGTYTHPQYQPYQDAPYQQHARQRSIYRPPNENPGWV